MAFAVAAVLGWAWVSAVMARLRKEVAQSYVEKFTSTAKLLAKKWAPYWPNSSGEPYASHINNRPKHVVSAALEEVEWGNWDNVSLIKGKLAEQIARLK